MAALEGGVAALAVASGAAAINYTIINLAQKGDHIVSAKNIYGVPTTFWHTPFHSTASAPHLLMYSIWMRFAQPFRRTQKPFISRPSETRTLMLSISKHLQKLRMRTKFRWLSIIPSQLHTSFVRSSTAQTSLFIPQLNLSAVTELPLVV